MGLAIHWFDRDLFLLEARRVLRRPGWLLLYESGFPGEMRENPAFKTWAKEYYSRFPAPPRNNRPLSAPDLELKGFREVLSETFTHNEIFSSDHLIAYLNSQTNVLAALGTGRETPRSIRDWMESGLLPLFAGMVVGTFEFQGWMRLAEAMP